MSGLRKTVTQSMRGTRRVLLALSGGMDSVVLFHCFLHLRSQGDFFFAAAHMEHGIRGEASLADMRFVEELCKANDVPLYLRQINAPALAKEKRCNLEHLARQERYAFFDELRTRHAFEWIATAHHLGDQAETMLMHMVRGAGLRGLSGMKERAGHVIRPLLGTTRREIAAYAQANKLAWREDATNEDPHYTRNHMRHEVFPHLRQINPSVEQAFGRLAKTSAEDEAFLSALAEEYLQKNKENGGLRLDSSAAPSILRRAILLFLLEQQLAEPGFNDVERIVQGMQRGRNTRLQAGAQHFEISYGVLYPQNPAQLGRHPVSPGRQTLPCGATLTLQTCQVCGTPNRGSNVQLFCSSILERPLAIRYPKDGDRMRPLGLHGSKLLSDIFTDAHIPRPLRSQIPLLVDEQSGEILWALGVKRGEGYLLKEGATNAAEMRFEKERNKGEN